MAKGDDIADFKYAGEEICRGGGTSLFSEMSVIGQETIKTSDIIKNSHYIQEKCFSRLKR